MERWTRAGNEGRRAGTTTSRRVALAMVLVIGFVATACSPGPRGGEAATPREVTTEWWGMGDSVFAGVGWQHPGAPSFLTGMENLAVAGNTLVEVTIGGERQPTVRHQLESAFARHGVPEHLIIHAGGADLFARVMFGATHDLDRYGEEYLALDAWLRDQGVDVWWSTVAPFTSWSIPGVGRQNELRLALNDWLRTHLADRLVDCESALLGGGGVWLDERYVLPMDGVHLNGTGARVHAACIGDQLGLAVE